MTFVPAVKRFNDWPAAVKVAGELASDLGVRFRVRREPVPVYGFHWWIVEPRDLSWRARRSATVAELHKIAELSAQAARRRREARL